jgi:hypothetical protein
MVNRTKISKEIRRRAGGPSRQPTAAEVRAASRNLAPNINRKGDWIPNPKYRPGDLNSNEPPMIPNPERRKDKPRALRSKEAEERRLKIAKEKARKEKARKARIARLQRETAAKADKGREARKAESEKPRGIIPRSTGKVTVKSLEAPSEREVAKVQPHIGKRGPNWHIRQGQSTERDFGGYRTKRQRTVEEMQEKEREQKELSELLKAISPPPSGTKRDRIVASMQKGPLDDILAWEKTGGKLSKSKGGTVKKMHGGTLHKKKKTKTTHTKKTKKTYGGHDGNKYVSKLYK